MRTKTLVRAILWVIPMALAATDASNAQSMAAPGPTAAPAYRRLPLTFEKNQGQTASDVKFLSRGRGYTAFLTAGSLVLSLRPGTTAPESAVAGTGKSATVRLALAGAATNPAVVGENPQPGRINYFLGNDPAKWHTNVPTYASVRYKNVYPGIDLVYYGSHRELEYDFEVLPGSDPRKIQFEIQGANQIDLDTEGNLVLKVGAGELRLQCPVVYQQINGQHAAVDGAYVLTDSTHVAFEISNYDSSKPLVIDPVLLYATYLGGSGTDQATGIAVDSSRSVYLAGYTSSINFPLTTLGSLSQNANHVFVAKLDSAGANLIYADYIGGNSEDYGQALVLDSANEVYVTGATASSNFPAVHAYQAQQPGPYTGFLTKVSADGSSLLYSTYLGGNTFDQPASIAIDSLGQVHVAGYTMSENFPVANAYQAAAPANQGGVYGIYGFLTKFSANGSSLVYSTYVAGSTVAAQNCSGTPCYPAAYSAVSAVAVDANDNAYVDGTTNTNNFPATSGAYLASNSTTQDANVGFVSKFNSAGGLAYSTYFYPTSGNPVGMSAIAVDGTGSAYVTGAADSDGTFPITTTGICDPSMYQFGCSYAFVTKFDPTGSTLLYSTFLGPNNYASPQAIALDSSNDAYVLASTTSPSFQTSNAIEAYTNQSDLLVVELDAAASTQLFSTYLGGSGNDTPAGMALDSFGNIYLTGSTVSSDFPVTQGAFQSLYGGNTDAFVAKIGPGTTSAVAMNPNALQYSAQNVGTTSQSQPVQLRNMSSTALAISSIAVTGDFGETDNCGTGLPAAGSCTLSVTFTPTVAGARTGSLQINDAATGSPQVVSLNGTGLGASVSLAPTSLTFSSTSVGVSTSSQPVTLSNQGNATLNISNIQSTGDYSQTNNCLSTLAAGSSCAVNVTFTPTAAGVRTGSLSINDGASGSPQTVALSGAGADFSLASTAPSASVNPGSTATYTVTVAPVSGSFSSQVSLACSGAPALTTCNLSSSAVTPGANTATVTVTITTTASSSAEAMPMTPAGRMPANAGPVYAVWMNLQGFALFGVLLVGSKLRKKILALIGVAVIGGLLFLTACAGGTGIGKQSQQGTTPGTYTVTVAGTSGSLQHSLPLTLIVQ
jgi:hypothetical protein